MKILVLNCGSSSIKYQLIDMDNNATLLAKGLLERIGLEMGEFTHKPVGKEKYYVQQPIPDHKAGIKMVLDALVDEKIGVIASLTEINACGHRVAHGGEVFKESVLVGEKEKEQIRALFALAPLHNPANLQGIEAMQAILPNVPQVAVFDTSFHQSMPAEAYLYAIPYEYYQTDKVRRYGFHGTSHRFVAPKAAKMAGLDINNSKIISCHLGSGASICAVKNGKSVDTSMGFTPVEGLIMGSRCGDLDLGVLLYIAEKENMTTKDMNNFINKKCGLNGITGGVVDMRDIMAGKREGKERETYAFDMFAYRVKKYIGAYAAAMGGVDAILFTGGIGENAWWQRQEICRGLEFLGAEIDEKQNEAMAGQDGIISKESSRVKILSVTTDEELVIAQDTYSIVKK
ncbi:MAG: acetate kinase [Bacteroidales bacterium]|nr:acetate kinase [Bacteroidales bacterium]